MAKNLHDEFHDNEQEYCRRSGPLRHKDISAPSIAKISALMMTVASAATVAVATIISTIVITSTLLSVSDICISYNANIPEVEKIILDALPEIFERNKDVWLSVPRYVGVDSLGESSVVLRFVVDVQEKNFFSARRRLNRELKILLDANNIEIPFNQIVVHQADKSILIGLMFSLNLFYLILNYFTLI